jgi:hypothetical protein
MGLPSFEEGGGSKERPVFRSTTKQDSCVIGGGENQVPAFGSDFSAVCDLRSVGKITHALPGAGDRSSVKRCGSAVSEGAMSVMFVHRYLAEG